MMNRIYRKVWLIATMLFLVSARINAQTHSDWLNGVQDNNQGLFAVTQNDSGNVLGEYCFWESETCIWLIVVDIKCDKDHTYPALGNTDSGAAPLTLVCDTKLKSGGTRMIFTEWERLESLFSKSEHLGIAYPLENDKFKVYRFSLKGLSDATAQIDKDFSYGVSQKNKRKKSGTQTQTL